MKEKYTSEMVKELLEDIIGIATAANMIAERHCGKLSEGVIESILRDLRNAKNKAMLIHSRMTGWDYAVFDALMMQEVKKLFEDHIHEDEET